MRRHWVATAVAGTLAAGLVAATGVSIVQARRAREQAARAEAQAVIALTESAKATQMNRFLTGMLSSANPSWTNANAARAGSITVREVLDGAGQVIQQELGATPDVEAEIRATLGSTYVALGALDAGKPHLERALALYRDIGNAVGVVRTQAVIGQERTRRGNFAEAEAVLRDALAGARRLGEAREPEVQVQVRSELALAIGYRQPASPEVLALLAEAVAINDRYGTRSVIVGVTVHNLGLQLLLAGRVDEAERLIRESLRVFESLPSVPNERVMALRSLSEVMRTTGDNVQAERLAGEAVAVAGRVYPPEFPHHPSLKTSWGRALVAVGQVERGRDVLLDAYSSFRRLRPAGHVDLLGPLVGLGAAHRRVGDLVASERVLEEARAIIRANPGVANSMPGIAGELGLTWRAMGRAAAAQAILEEAHAHLLRLYGESHPSTKRALARVNGATE